MPHIPSVRLKAYVCHTQYLIQSHISYYQLSISYRDFISNANAIFEPSFHHQVVHFSKWRQSMEEELEALEANNTRCMSYGKKTMG